MSGVLDFSSLCFREFTCFSFWLCWLNARCIRGITELGEPWNHVHPATLFAADENDYFRNRQSNTVKFPNTARLRKLHLKTDIQIAGNRSYFRGSSFQNFTGDCLQRSNHARASLKSVYLKFFKDRRAYVYQCLLNLESIFTFSIARVEHAYFVFHVRISQN